MKLKDLPDLETVAEMVHNSWWKEKTKQGFHAPADCPQMGCVNCHPNMIPYDQLSEMAKDLDRATVRMVYEAIIKAGKKKKN